MAIALRSPSFDVVITPERGSDIVELIDRETGVQTLAQSPTGDVTPGAASVGDSMTQWMRGYPGGWQMLLPNAGPERKHDGVVQGYHGEASLARWHVSGQSEDSVVLRTSLLTAPLHIERNVSLVGPRLTVTDTIINRSTVECSFRLVQHPAFGAPFLDDESYLVTNAATLLADAEAPGTLLAPNATGRPETLLTVGPVPRSVALPGQGSGDSLFAALTDFPSGAGDDDQPAVTFCSPSRGFGMRLSWDPTVYPHAWFWIEANSGSGWPWFKRLFAAAIEPSNVLPGEGPTPGGLRRGGIGTTLAGGATLTSTIHVDRVSLSPTIISSRDPLPTGRRGANSEKTGN